MVACPFAKRAAPVAASKAAVLMGQVIGVEAEAVATAAPPVAKLCWHATAVSTSTSSRAAPPSSTASCTLTVPETRVGSTSPPVEFRICEITIDEGGSRTSSCSEADACGSSTEEAVMVASPAVSVCTRPVDSFTEATPAFEVVKRTVGWLAFWTTALTVSVSPTLSVTTPVGVTLTTGAGPLGESHETSSAIPSKHSRTSHVRAEAVRACIHSSTNNR
jgi:hypothetical protein